MNVLASAALMPEWRWLAKRGWVIKPHPTNVSNKTDVTAKTIWLTLAAYWRPNARHLRYVLLHECVHAIQGEALGGAPLSPIAKARNIDWRSAREVIADAYCLDVDKSLRMAAWARRSMLKKWVPGSVSWHGRHTYRYSMADLRSREASAVVKQLEDIVRRG